MNNPGIVEITYAFQYILFDLTSNAWKFKYDFDIFDFCKKNSQNLVLQNWLFIKQHSLYKDV